MQTRDRLAEHPRAETRREPRLVGDGEEVRGRERPQGRVLPADERLGAERRHTGERDDRLVVQMEPRRAWVAVERASQRLGELTPLDDGKRLRSLLAAPAQLLRVHRGIGFGEERFRVGADAPVDGADAREHLKGEAVDVQRDR